MRTLCDVCESAAAIFFCAADEAALCRSCDDKVHRCNKLANRHIRVGLAAPSAVPKCDICENEPAFFYCEIDGSSLCLQCDMLVHVGGKRTHRRYLLLRQRAEFPGDKSGVCDDVGSNRGNQGEVRREQNQSSNVIMRENEQNYVACVVPTRDGNGNGNDNGKGNGVAESDSQMIDLNARPRRINEVSTSNQGMDITGAHGDSTSVVPTRSFRSEAQK